MKNMTLKASLCSLLLIAGHETVLEAKTADDPDVKIKINDIQVEDTVYTPYYRVETEQDHQQGAAQRWLRLGVYFTTEGGWIDELEIRQLATFKSPQGKNVVLAESERYINLNPGDHYVYMYLHPSYVERYEIDASKVDSAAFLLLKDKELNHRETSMDNEKGWSRKTNGDTEKGYLLNHAETPFWFINYDFKEVIKR